MCTQINWRPLHSVICLWPKIIWDRLQLPLTLKKRNAIEKRMDLGFQFSPFIVNKNTKKSLSETSIHISLIQGPDKRPLTQIDWYTKDYRAHSFSWPGPQFGPTAWPHFISIAGRYQATTAANHRSTHMTMCVCVCVCCVYVFSGPNESG